MCVVTKTRCRDYWGANTSTWPNALNVRSAAMSMGRKSISIGKYISRREMRVDHEKTR